jgi:sterile alpha motif and leucine zipper-containing kinase AZK
MGMLTVCGNNALQECPGWRLYGSWSIRLELARQAAAAVAYMHAQNIVHRDLTSYNLLVTDKWECKLADFNLSRAINDAYIPHSGQINSPEWSAPERLSGQVASCLSSTLRQRAASHDELGH